MKTLKKSGAEPLFSSRPLKTLEKIKTIPLFFLFSAIPSESPVTYHNIF